MTILSYLIGMCCQKNEIRYYFNNYKKPFHLMYNTKTLEDIFKVSKNTILNFFNKMEEKGYMKYFTGRNQDGSKSQLLLLNLNKIEELIGYKPFEFDNKEIEIAINNHTKNKSQLKVKEATVEQNPTTEEATQVGQTEPSKDDVEDSIEEPVTEPEPEVETDILITDEEIQLLKDNGEEWLLDKWLASDKTPEEIRLLINSRFEVYEANKNGEYDIKEPSVFDDDYIEKTHPHLKSIDDEDVNEFLDNRVIELRYAV